MELRVLRYFLAVAQEANFSRAAESLHITQPALSRQIADMEKELGIKLFVRGKKTLLTEDGMLMKRRAEEILELTDRTCNEFLHRSQDLVGDVSIGCAETVGARDLAKLITSFQKEHPLVRFLLYTGNADTIRDRLNRGLADFGLFIEPVDVASYNFVRLKEIERWGLLMRADDPLAKESSIPSEILPQLPLMMTLRPSIRKEIIRHLSLDEEKLNIVSTYNLIGNAARLVDMGVGYALTIEGSVDLYDKCRFAFVPLAPILESRTVIAWKKVQRMEKASTKFAEHIYNFRL